MIAILAKGYRALVNYYTAQLIHRPAQNICDLRKAFAQMLAVFSPLEIILH